METVFDTSLLDARDNPTLFRERVREWLARVLPPNWRAQQAAASEDVQIEFQRWWFAELGKIGMASSHWPAQWGGQELGIEPQIIFYEELARADAPIMAAFAISLNQVPATFFGAGTPEQKKKYVAGVLNGDVWCQGFSEPNSGSDLASLRTSARREGDSYIVNGQKIWTSNAHFADYCLLLVRTDPASTRHSGMSMFVMDMKTPGITLRNIRQANNQGEFNEMFLDDVVIPAENLIGEEGQGWTIAQSALSSERGLIIFDKAERLRRFLHSLLAEQRAHPTWIRDDEHRREFMRAICDSEGLMLMIHAMLRQNAEHAEVAGQSAPMLIKLHFAVMLQRFCALMVRVHGLDGQIMQPDIATQGAPSGNWMFDYITSWGWTIAGGSNEVIRNLVAERVIGLPR